MRERSDLGVSNAATPQAVIDAAVPEPALSDAAIVARVMAGDTALFELLMRRYNRLLFRLARGIAHDDDEARELLRGVFGRALRLARAVSSLRAVLEAGRGCAETRPLFAAVRRECRYLGTALDTADVIVTDAGKEFGEALAAVGFALGHEVRRAFEGWGEEPGDAGLVAVYPPEMADRVATSVASASSKVHATAGITGEHLAADVRAAEQRSAASIGDG